MADSPGPVSPGAHPIKITMFPPGWDPMGGQWLAVPLSDLTISGKVTACLECGAVVVPQLMGVHSRRCGGTDRG